MQAAAPPRGCAGPAGVPRAAPAASRAASRAPHVLARSRPLAARPNRPHTRPAAAAVDAPSAARVGLGKSDAREEVEHYPAPAPVEQWVDRFGDAPRKGSDILVQALERQGVDIVFAYPGGASLEIHQALTRSDTVQNVLCRHEQGEIFAAEGYSKTTGRVSVCIATSGPGATNLVTGLADALLDSVPMVAITGQVPRALIGTDSFQETPIVEVSRQITKHTYLVMDVNDIPRVVKEAFFLARSGRPGPVLVDIPKDVQQSLAVPDWDAPMELDSYISRMPGTPSLGQLAEVVGAIKRSKKPVLYVGGGCQDSAEELREFVRLTGIPVTQTLMGLGSFSETDPLSLGMLGMHGTEYANFAVNDADLLLAFGVRFDDRVTGKLETFAANARVVHIDIDPAEIHKNKFAHVPICADIKPALRGLNELLRVSPVNKEAFAPWVKRLDEEKEAYPLGFPSVEDECIWPQWAVQVLYEESKGDAIITTGVGQHQMWAAQFYPFQKPRRWASSGGLGSMGFGLPSAIGAAAAHDGKRGRPHRVVVDIDGDGSFLMNVQELATAKIEEFDVKCFVLNNQYLGMVMQWEDRFYKANRAHTYLGRKENDYQETKDVADIYPDFVKMAGAFGIPARRVVKPSELREAIREMLDTPGPYLLDVVVPHIQHVLPMIPGGGSFKDIITTGDGTVEY